MTRRWKLKTNSSNILLVLITLILVEAEWARGETLVGNDQIARHLFGGSASDESLLLRDVNGCLESFQLTTCLKMLLLERVSGLVAVAEGPGFGGTDVRFLRGGVVFKAKNATGTSGEGEEEEDAPSLDEEIALKVRRLFRNRSLFVSLIPGLGIEIEPKAVEEGKKKDGDLVCFRYTIQKEEESKGESPEGRKRKGGGMPMMMLVPQMIMLGLMPFTLASLKAMVMNAVMINMMALNGAIFMTIRNLVFGPKSGDNVKYVNYGYSKDRQTQSKRPVLIIHSPAAFVKQPPTGAPLHHRRRHQLQSAGLPGGLREAPHALEEKDDGFQVHGRRKWQDQALRGNHFGLEERKDFRNGDGMTKGDAYQRRLDQRVKTRSGNPKATSDHSPEESLRSKPDHWGASAERWPPESASRYGPPRDALRTEVLTSAEGR